ncbi:hypothetical protein SLNSH_10405 [Alsobacter soli]|uniref:Flagellin n=1 Tax=Alsobacter soli TaxID=2109933 RepID=A0A2T1HU61_9HYPH|nr:flagellin [Alsobacter soli]PSC05213.1 hypothetical protein SLNSH_10405 [Alsobacter soli]
MTITSTSLGAYSLDVTRTRQNAARLTDMKSQLTDLQRQLSTGKLADSYAAMGAGRGTSLSVRQTLTTLDGYSAAVTDATNRAAVLDKTLTRMQAISTTTANGLALSSFSPNANGLTTEQVSAKASLTEMISLLNQDYAGRSLFAGRSADQPAVTVDANAMISGVQSAIATRRANDAGAPGNIGNLTISSTAAGQVSISPTAATPAYGFGMNPAQSFDFGAAPPTDGQSFQVNLLMPDGAARTVTLVARTSVPAPNAPAGEISFAIGGSGGATATNFVNALTPAVQAVTASSEFWASSAVAGAKDYFANLSNWYGGSASSDPRAGASSYVDDGQTVGLGMEASEPAFQNMLAQLGVLAAQTFPTATATDQANYAALTQRVQGQLNAPVVPATPAPGAYTIKQAQTDVGLASATLKNAQQWHTDTKAQLENALSGVEDATPEAVAAQLLSLQTQLQASYQTTSMLSKMSLVNYL